jgi:hypothetical protein
MTIYGKQGVTMFLLVYAEDITVTKSSLAVVVALLQDLKSEFALKDLKNLHYFLGIQVKKQGNGIVLSMEKYAHDLLEKSGMKECKSVITHLPTSEKLSLSEGTRLGEEDSTGYMSIVGALQYLTLTRPNIAFSVNRVCQFLHALPG